MIYLWRGFFFLKCLLINYFFMSIIFLSVTKLYLCEPLLLYLPQHFSPTWLSANVGLKWSSIPPMNQESRKYLIFFFYMNVSKGERSLSPVLSTFFRHPFATDFCFQFAVWWIVAAAQKTTQRPNERWEQPLPRVCAHSYHYPSPSECELQS